MVAAHAVASVWLQGLLASLRELAAKRRVRKRGPAATVAFGVGVCGVLPKLLLAGGGTHQPALDARLDGALVRAYPGIPSLPLREVRQEVLQVPLARALRAARRYINPLTALMGIMGHLQRLAKNSAIPVGGVSAIVPPQQRFPSARAAFRGLFGMFPQFHDFGG